jgi:hypothetical protein
MVRQQTCKRLGGSVESCGGGLVKPASNDHSKCPTTTGCNSTLQYAVRRVVYGLD